MKSYVRFELLEKKKKTNVYLVVSKSSGASLGRIRWYFAWRQYVFEPFAETVWSRGCMEEVREFIKELMDARKGKK